MSKLITLHDLEKAGWDISFFVDMCVVDICVVEEHNITIPELFHWSSKNIEYTAYMFDTEARDKRMTVRDGQWRYCFVTAISKTIAGEIPTEMFSMATIYAFIGARNSHRNDNPKQQAKLLKIESEASHITEDEKINIIKSFLDEN